MRKICVITGTRAEYGLLYWLLKGIQEDNDFILQILVTGMHLSPEFGYTYKQIEEDGFKIDAKVEMLLSSDTHLGVAKSTGLGVICLAEAIENLSPDMIVILGDRFEAFAAAQATMILQKPLVHLCGGDNGLGTYDNIIRHCISKMANIHFVTHEKARHRLIQLGESPDRVFNYGATSVENIKRLNLFGKHEVEEELGIHLQETVFLITFHPLTMDDLSSELQLNSLLNALDDIRTTVNFSAIFTKSNADTGGRALNEILTNYVKVHSDCYLFDSLGQIRYLSVMKYASVVIGNSSSGIYEAPYLETPTVDIGNRQSGRDAPTSVIRCGSEEIVISEAIRKALRFKFENVVMIYGDGVTTPKIIDKMKEFTDLPNLTIKRFNDLKNEVI